MTAPALPYYMQISWVKQLGLGLAVAVLVDVFLVRMLLVPILMLQFGESNWAATGPLRRLYTRFGSKESAGVQTPDKVSA
jgi:RND superfamily putative drug exporter